MSFELREVIVLHDGDAQERSIGGLLSRFGAGLRFCGGKPSHDCAQEEAREFAGRAKRRGQGGAARADAPGQ